MLATLATNFLWGCSAICCLKLNELWAYFAVSKTLPSSLPLSLYSFYNSCSFLCCAEKAHHHYKSWFELCPKLPLPLCLSLVTYRSWRIYYNFVYRDALELPITQRAGGGGVGNPL